MAVEVGLSVMAFDYQLLPCDIVCAFASTGRCDGTPGLEEGNASNDVAIQTTLPERQVRRCSSTGIVDTSQSEIMYCVLNSARIFLFHWGSTVEVSSVSHGTVFRVRISTLGKLPSTLTWRVHKARSPVLFE